MWFNHPQRQDRYWRGTVVVDNASAPVYAAVVVTGMTASVTNQQSGTRFVARTPEAFGYDPDGNLTNDGRFAYFWDTENRLIAAEELCSPTNRGRIRVENRYDGQSRRVEKTVYEWQTNGWSLLTDRFFYYDGWNLVREERRPDTKGRTVSYSYVWGLDLSGSEQGAGGIGGLLSATYGVGTSVVASLYYTFDGNGNVADVTGASGALAAHYEYDPFGNVLVATGPQAKDNPFRFSTKFADDETGLVYYGYRFYAPGVGRWVNRDPLGEAGGLNLYVIVHNRPADRHDPFGLTNDPGDFGWDWYTTDLRSSYPPNLFHHLSFPSLWRGKFPDGSFRGYDERLSNDAWFERNFGPVKDAAERLLVARINAQICSRTREGRIFSYVDSSFVGRVSVEGSALHEGKADLVETEIMGMQTQTEIELGSFAATRTAVRGEWDISGGICCEQ